MKAILIIEEPRSGASAVAAALLAAGVPMGLAQFMALPGRRCEWDDISLTNLLVGTGVYERQPATSASRAAAYWRTRLDVHDRLRAAGHKPLLSAVAAKSALAWPAVVEVLAGAKAARFTPHLVIVKREEGARRASFDREMRPLIQDDEAANWWARFERQPRPKAPKGALEIAYETLLEDPAKALGPLLDLVEATPSGREAAIAQVRPATAVEV